MTTPDTNSSLSHPEGFFAKLSTPLTRFWTFFSWLGATTVFFAIADALGGPTEGDVAESAYSTWAVAHGRLACMYPPNGGHQLNDLANPFALTAPLYPIISGTAAFVLRIGHAVGFPSQHQLGPRCEGAFVAMFNWSVKASVIMPTIRLSYLMWPVMAIGAVLLLRSTDRGRTFWEPFSLVLLACTPPLIMCLTSFFHPQDLLAMGLVLGGLGLALRNKWGWSGALLGLAFTSQQFALLVAAPLLLIVPARHRIRYLTGAVIAILLVDGPVIVSTSGRALKTALFGSNRTGDQIVSTGGTVLWETHVKGVVLFTLSRVVPIVAALALTWWAKRRLGSRLLEPILLVSLATTALGLRLVFEENLFGYYFMALAVGLVMLDVLRGSVRGHVVAWIALVTLAFNPVHWGLYSNWTPWDQQLHNALPIIFLGVALLIIVRDTLRHRLRGYIVAWFVLVALTCGPRISPFNHGIIVLPNWIWQILLVPLGLVFAIEPVWREAHQAHELAAATSA